MQEKLRRTKKMQEKLILNDGTELSGHAFVDGLFLYLYLNQNTLTEAFPLLNDPDKTAQVTEDRNGQITEYTGFSHLRSISEESGGMVSAVLRKEVNV